jgi:biopolymer transport protein ExbD
MTEAAPQINLTPLIDVVLVLLIVFMVLTPRPEHDLAIQLSAAKRTQNPSEVAPTQIIVAVDGKNALRINDTPIKQSEYLDQLHNMLTGRRPSDQVVFVLASDATSYATLIQAIDVAKRAGATAVGFATDAKP